MNKSKLGSAETLEVINLYLNGESSCSIAPMYNVQPLLITRVLKRWGIKLRSLSKAHILSFSQGRRHRIYKVGAECHAWKGGHKAAANGYVFVRCPAHPNVYADGYILEHVLVMEKHLARYLKKGEIVHHRNENRSDNRLENLWLTNPSGHQFVHRWLRNKTFMIDGELLITTA